MTLDPSKGRFLLRDDLEKASTDVKIMVDFSNKILTRMIMTLRDESNHLSQLVDDINVSEQMLMSACVSACANVPITFISEFMSDLTIERRRQMCDNFIHILSEYKRIELGGLLQ